MRSDLSGVSSTPVYWCCANRPYLSLYNTFMTFAGNSMLSIDSLLVGKEGHIFKRMASHRLVLDLAHLTAFSS